MYPPTQTPPPQPAPAPPPAAHLDRGLTEAEVMGAARVGAAPTPPPAPTPAPPASKHLPFMVTAAKEWGIPDEVIEQYTPDALDRHLSALEARFANHYQAFDGSALRGRPQPAPAPQLQFAPPPPAEPDPLAGYDLGEFEFEPGKKRKLQFADFEDGVAQALRKLAGDNLALRREIETDRKEQRQRQAWDAIDTAFLQLGPDWADYFGDASGAEMLADPRQYQDQLARRAAAMSAAGVDPWNPGPAAALARKLLKAATALRGPAPRQPAPAQQPPNPYAVAMQGQQQGQQQPNYQGYQQAPPPQAQPRGPDGRYLPQQPQYPSQPPPRTRAELEDEERAARLSQQWGGAGVAHPTNRRASELAPGLNGQLAEENVGRLLDEIDARGGGHYQNGAAGWRP